MPPWVEDIFEKVVGPWGAVFLLMVMVYFLWRLFREKDEENRQNFLVVSQLTEVVRELTAEVRGQRTGTRR